jgi:hypothetical protein
MGGRDLQRRQLHQLQRLERVPRELGPLVVLVRQRTHFLLTELAPHPAELVLLLIQGHRLQPSPPQTQVRCLVVTLLMVATTSSAEAPWGEDGGDALVEGLGRRVRDDPATTTG